MSLHHASAGTRSMRERAAELGGLLQISRREPRGTVVTATLPLEVSRS